MSELFEPFERAEQFIAACRSDMATSGTRFIASPDLVARLRNRWPLAHAKRDTLYGGAACGYTDYPTFNFSAARINVPKTDKRGSV